MEVEVTTMNTSKKPSTVLVTTALLLAGVPGCFDEGEGLVTPPSAEDGSTGEADAGEQTSGNEAPDDPAGTSTTDDMEPATTGPAPDDEDDANDTDNETGETEDETGEADDESSTGDDLPAVCGDGIVSGDEFCDDGENLGRAMDECIPGCASAVQRKQIRVSEEAVNGGFTFDSSLSASALADTFCNEDEKAMFADGDERIASVTPWQADGQVDWALAPYTEYVNEQGDVISTTGELALLGVDDDQQWTGLEHPISEIPLKVWTGLFDDYVTHSENCSNWTDDDAFAFLTQGANGLPAEIDTNAVGTDLVYGRGFCFEPHYFYCVEQ